MCPETRGRWPVGNLQEWSWSRVTRPFFQPGQSPVEFLIIINFTINIYQERIPKQSKNTIVYEIHIYIFAPFSDKQVKIVREKMERV